MFQAKVFLSFAWRDQGTAQILNDGNGFSGYGGELLCAACSIGGCFCFPSDRGLDSEAQLAPKTYTPHPRHQPLTCSRETESQRLLRKQMLADMSRTPSLARNKSFVSGPKRVKVVGVGNWGLWLREWLSGLVSRSPAEMCLGTHLRFLL